VQNDVTYIAIILGLFVVMFGLVRACDKIIGSDEAAFEEQGGAPSAATSVDDEAVAA
jgi:hypothetical protein